MTAPVAAVRSIFQLVTLGRLSLLAPSGAEEPSLATRRTKLALLAYLAMQRRPVSRGALATLLWGEKDEEKARSSLSEALSHFRRVLGQDAIASYQSDVALETGGRLVVDAALLEAAARAHDHAQVVALYAGPFLDDVLVVSAPDWEQWASRERLRLESLFVASCGAQCMALARARRWPDCAALAERWLEARPASEEAALYLLEALRAPGTLDAAIAALEAWRRLARRLRDEYDLAPAPAVARVATELERAARDGAPRPPTRRTSMVGAMLHHVRASDARAAGMLPPGDLPVPTMPMVGREAAAGAITTLLQDARLVTLVGPGGIGKSRLAMHVAAAVAGEQDAAYWIPLNAVDDPALAIATIAARLRVSRAVGHDALDAHEQARAIAERLAGRRVLLVLDGCEPLAADSGPIGALLAAAGGVRVLATSQMPLRLAGEHVVPVRPLALPPPSATPTQAAEAPAVALFAQCARAAAPEWTIGDDAAEVAALCARLDGIPLAIELAASRVRVLPPRALLARLGNAGSPLDGLPPGAVRDAPARHRTLRAALSWMHDLLDAPERALFQRLAVFAGSATLQAVEEVCAGEPIAGAIEVLDALDALAERSLVVLEREVEGELRVRLLSTIGAFARERLTESGEERRTRARHAAWYARFVESAATGDVAAQAQLGPEGENVRAAHAWAMAEDAPVAERLTVALARVTAPAVAPTTAGEAPRRRTVAGRALRAEG